MIDYKDKSYKFFDWLSSH